MTYHFLFSHFAKGGFSHNRGKTKLWLPSHEAKITYGGRELNELRRARLAAACKEGSEFCQALLSGGALSIEEALILFLHLLFILQP